MTPDHLGSTSYITSRNGSISQHVEYIAFGEVLFEEHNSSFSSPYLFNGKELDRETNLSYYGARYYDFETKLADYTFNDSNYSALSNIAEHYGNVGGINMKNLHNGKISIGDLANGERKGSYVEGQLAGYNGGKYKVDDEQGFKVLMYTAIDEKKVVINLFGGKLQSSELSDKYNFMSTLDHEGGPIGHLLNPDKKHSDIYKDQISKWGKKVSEGFLKLLNDNLKMYKNGND